MFNFIYSVKKRSWYTISQQITSIKENCRYDVWGRQNNFSPAFFRLPTLPGYNSVNSDSDKEWASGRIGMCSNLRNVPTAIPSYLAEALIITGVVQNHEPRYLKKKQSLFPDRAKTSQIGESKTKRFIGFLDLCRCIRIGYYGSYSTVWARTDNKYMNKQIVRKFIYSID